MTKQAKHRHPPPLDPAHPTLPDPARQVALRKILKKYDKLCGGQRGRSFLQHCWQLPTGGAFLHSPLLDELKAIQASGAGTPVTTRPGLWRRAWCPRLTCRQQHQGAWHSRAGSGGGPALSMLALGSRLPTFCSSLCCECTG